MIVAGQIVQPLNHTVIFLRETDITLSSDSWHILINVNLSTYSDVISTLRSDLWIIEHQTQEFTPIHELKQIEALLQTLESKLHDFHQILPRLDPRRALLDFGGTIWKTLFGAATISDMNSLHDVINDLQLKNLDISHSLSSQLTYVKDLSTTTNINSPAITNLSSVIKDNIISPMSSFSKLLETFYGRTLLFISRIHCIQQLSKWKSL